MNAYSLQAEFETRNVPSRREALPSWCSFVLGAIATFSLVYVGISRPMRQQMADLQQQVQDLQASVGQLVAVKPGAKVTTDLLTTLTKQQQTVAAAEAALRDMQLLLRDVEAQAVDVAVASESLAELAGLKDSVLLAGDRVQAANTVLIKAEVLQERLASSQRLTDSALMASSSMLEISDALAQRQTEVVQSQATLRGMLAVQDELQAHSGGLDTALDQIQNFVLLKDTVLARSSNLVEAIEALELVAELTHNFELAADSFENIRRWMFEVVAAESVMEQARRVLMPLLEITDLRRLDARQLRAVAESLREQWPAQSDVRTARTLDTQP